MNETKFTLSQISNLIAEMVTAQQAGSTSISRVIVAVAYAANVGFPDAKTGKLTPTAGPANEFFKALRKGVKKDLIAGVLDEHCNLGLLSGAWQLYDAGCEWTDESVAKLKAAAGAWEEYKAPVKAKGAFDVLAELAKVIEAHGKAVKAARVVVDGGAIDYVNAIIAKYSADKAIAQAISEGRVIAAPKAEAALV